MHPSSQTIPKLLEDCTIRRTRHSGPGGQHRNKVETAIEIVHEPTGTVAFAAERRSQDQNREVAIFRLRLLLAVRIRAVTGSEVLPSEMWSGRCRHQKINCNERHADFPAMLAEALDAINAKDYDVRRAAAALGCSSTQLVRFIAHAPEALKHLNEEREHRGLRALRP